VDNAMPEIKVSNLDKGKEYSKKEGKGGVYIWGYYEGETFIPLYVGQAENMYARLIQHYCSVKGGEYRLRNIDKLERSYVYQENINKAKIIYEPTSFKEVLKGVSDIVINQTIGKIVNNFAFRYEEVAKADRDTLEWRLTDLISKDMLISSVSRPKVTELKPDLKEIIKRLLPEKADQLI